MTAIVSTLRASALDLRTWPLQRWLLALVAAGAAALVTGIPTDLVPTPLFRRMTPIVWWDWPLWILGSVLLGLVAATYVRADRRATPAKGGVLVGGGLLTVLAVGCPICNKLVVLALGTAGALTYFAPIQPALGLLSVLLASVALVVRTGAGSACRVEVADGSLPLGPGADS